MADKKELTPEELLKVAQEENKKLAAELKVANASLVKAGEDAQKLAGETSTTIQGLKDVIKELNEAIELRDVQAQKGSKRPVFKVGKKSFELRIPKFVHNFKGERTEVDASVLLKNPELVAELVEKKSGALIEIGGK